MKQYWNKSVLWLLSLAAVITATSCEEVIPYPDTGATEMMHIEGAIGGGVSRFSVKRIFPISEKTFVSQKEKTLLEASMRLTVNGKEVPVACNYNDSLVCVFSTEYAFQAKDRISVNVSAPGVPDVNCETTVPDLPEVKDVSYNLLDDNTLDINATVRIHPEMMDGYAYFLEKEENKVTYIDGIFESETTETLIQCLPERDYDSKTIYYHYYRYYPVTGYEAADGNGMHHLSTNVELSTSYEMPDEEGRIVRTEYTVKRIRFCAWHLSAALYLGLKTNRKKQDYDPDSPISFVTPLEYSNVTGGKGYIGAVSTYQSEWREL